MHKCEICGKMIMTGDPCHFVKLRGQPVRWYCEKCVKGGAKDGKEKR